MSDQAVGRRADILVVDDTPANLRLLSQMLSVNGYGVRAVTSGPRALESVRAAPPNLILLDIRMPQMDGYEVCQILKADEKTRDIPIIFISALSEIQDKVRAFEIGGVDYITKPFQLEEVLARTETHLALRELQEQLQDANKKFERELALAGKLQTSFLPSELPDIPGWQLSVGLKPARETSGDFFDVYPLPNGLLGILVADVVDKGVAAALFMALSWSLVRTYIAEYPTEPELVFDAVNRRILEDTGGYQFVTVFYGILDPTSGKLSYCNAGQSPPCLIGSRERDRVEQFMTTGTPLGLFDDKSWERREATIAPGDVLVLYTDGVTDAQNQNEDFFGEERLFESVRAKLGLSAKEIQDSILADISEFMGDSHQFDDIALVVVAREPLLGMP